VLGSGVIFSSDRLQIVFDIDYVLVYVIVEVGIDVATFVVAGWEHEVEVMVIARLTTVLLPHAPCGYG